MRKTLTILATACAACLAVSAFGQTPEEVKKGVEQYREMLELGNPAELYALKGEELFKKKRGPKNASLEQCDFGKGPGVLKGAYAEMPRYFADTGKVQDLESRLVTCMVQLQGFSEKDATKRPFGNADKPSENEQLVAYIVSQSYGDPIKISLDNPKMKEAYEIGKRLFYYRAGPWDFSCATCHAEENTRIRLQDLPVLSSPAGAKLAMTTWPAYRVSNSQLKTFEWRINDCYRQMRFPEPNFISDSVIALTTYLAYTANGGVYKGPGIKR
jgi:sulfur-oxidizing protein SoxA